MRTTYQSNFRIVGVRARIVATITAVTLFVCVAVWGLGRDVNATSPVAVSGFLYVLHDCSQCENAILGFAVDEASGTLTPLTNGFPVLTGGNGIANNRGELLVVDANNLRLFVVNDGSNTISAFRINPATGTLTPMFSPIALGPGLWTTANAHSSCNESLVVVGSPEATNPGPQLTSLRITDAGGTAVSLKSTVDALPFSSVFSRDGKFVYTGGGGPGSKFAGFNIDASGTLNLIGIFDSGSADPRAYATDAARRLFMANGFFQQQQLRAFNTDANGVPTLIVTPSVVSTVREAGQGVMLADDQFYAFSDREPGSHLIAVYRISNTGRLTQVNSSPFQSPGKGVTLLAANRDGTLLFALNSSTLDVTTFRVDATAGALTVLKTQPVIATNTDKALSGMAYLPPSSGPIKTSTRTTIDAPAISFGEEGKVTVTVTSDPPGTTISGQVELSVDGVALTPQPLKPDGTATFTTPALAVGPHELIANFIPATPECIAVSSATATLVVNLAETFTSIDPPTIRLGQTGSATVIVRSGFARPFGNVSFSVDGGTVSTKLLSPGPNPLESSASFNLGQPALGLHTLRANFAEQNGFKASKAIKKFIVQLPLKTVTKISAATVTPQIPSVGQTIPVKVTVTTGQFFTQNASGKVSLQVANLAKVTKALSGGSATFNVLVPKSGILFLRATFPLQDGFAASRATRTLFVTPAPPSETQP